MSQYEFDDIMADLEDITAGPEDEQTRDDEDPMTFVPYHGAGSAAERLRRNAVYGKRPQFRDYGNLTMGYGESTSDRPRLLLPPLASRVVPRDVAFPNIVLAAVQSESFVVDPMVPFKGKSLYAYGEPAGIVINTLRVGNEICLGFECAIPLEHFSVAAIILALTEAKMPPDQIEAYLQKRHAVEMAAATPGRLIMIELTNTTKRSRSARIVLKGQAIKPFGDDVFTQTEKEEKLRAASKPISTLDNRIAEVKKEEPESDDWEAWASPGWEEP